MTVRNPSPAARRLMLFFSAVLLIFMVAQAITTGSLMLWATIVFVLTVGIPVAIVQGRKHDRRYKR
ncbi:MAG TPA: hypothetical protein VLE72_04435 [Candidatus Saccharimonadales bacterium]|nr:hypothetical protein [Candidatus Saccharimonadales bacterium]